MFLSTQRISFKRSRDCLFKEKGKVAQKWDELFTDHTLINFTYKNQPLSGFRVGRL